MDWLLKTEPSTYSFEDLVREKTTTWDGVTNAQARPPLRSWMRGARPVSPPRGAVPAAGGRPPVGAAPRPDPADPKGTVVDVKAGRALKKPVTLAEMKAAKVFAGSPLLTIGRLSVVPLTAEQYAFVVGE